METKGRFLVRPGSTEDVSKVLKIANYYRMPVHTWGGGSGSQGGALPLAGGILLDMKRMDRLIEIDDESHSITAEAGMIFQRLEWYANERGMSVNHIPSCLTCGTIGGALAHRGIGITSTKYGKIDDQCMSLEVVLPDGTIIDTLPVPKHAAGPDLNQIFIGSEGTLGIITKATVKLLPKPKYALDLLAVFDSPEQAIGAVGAILKQGIVPTCVEYMDNITIRSVERYLHEKLQGSDSGNYLIVEVEGINDDDLDDKAVALDELCTQHGASSVLVADHNKIWQARKAFAEAVRAESLIVSKEDVVVPVDQEPLLLAEILRLADKYSLITRIASHAGDGNIHLNILKPDDTPYEDWARRVEQNQQELYAFIYAHGGRLSGEHGIGFKRKHLMEEFTNPDELAMMKAIKKALDPNNILNPGKIFDIE